MGRLLVVFLFMLCACEQTCRPELTEEEFLGVLTAVAQSWEEGDARKAVQFFSDNAIYEEPPKRQLYRGKKEIFEFFGGEKGFNKPMKMEWHKISFNEDEQTGFGEYTFSTNNPYHGIVVMKFLNKKIIEWREYQYRSALNWKEFAGGSKFESGVKE